MTATRIDSLKEGMEVSSDAKNDSGMVIITKGTVLTEKHLRAFKAWGVLEIEIKGAEEAEATILAWDDVDLETKNEISNAVDRLYIENDRNDPVIMELEKITIAALVKRHSREAKTQSIERVS